MSKAEPGDDVPAIVVRRLEPSDDRSTFRSGDLDLDRFFHRYAGEAQFSSHIGMTWVVMEGAHVLGFVTVRAAHLEVGDLSEEQRWGLPAFPLPVLRVGRMAVAADAQGEGIGRLLLRAVFMLAWLTKDAGGCVGVVAEPPEEALGFYRSLGFRELELVHRPLGHGPRPTPMFLELQAIPRSPL